VKGDTIEIFPAYLDTALRVEVFGDVIEKIQEIQPLTGKVIGAKEKVYIYPARHFVTSQPTLQKALVDIENEMKEQLQSSILTQETTTDLLQVQQSLDLTLEVEVS
jgi:excinuclease ABC subunit B